MRHTAPLFLAFLVCAASSHAQERAPQIPAGYRVEKIQIPEGVALEVGGLAFRPNGHLLITTRFGEVWDYHEETWTLFADGLQEALGVLVDAETGAVYVAQKPELTELIDTDGDHRADVYRSVCSAWGFSSNYHEYVFGPVRDKEGNFYLTLNLAAIGGGPGSVRKSTMAHPTSWRGWCVQVKPDGTFTPFASGLRSPAGIGITPEDEIFVTDNQGDWVATSTLFHVERGKFYGHPSSLYDDPAWSEKNLDEVPIEEFDSIRTLPAVWFPHGMLANSPGEPVVDTTGGKFGPFAGQMFVGDQTQSNVMRISLEKVGGAYQGVVFNFVDGLRCGVIRSTFAPDGSLWIGQTDRGWGSKGDEPFGLRRIVYDGQTTPFEMKTIRVTPTGFRIELTRPLAADAAPAPADFRVTHWGYDYHADYGSDRKEVTSVTPSAATVSPDRLSITLTLPELVTKRVYQITVANLRGEDDAQPSCDTGFYTLNALPQ